MLSTQSSILYARYVPPQECQAVLFIYVKQEKNIQTRKKNEQQFGENARKVLEYEYE